MIYLDNSATTRPAPEVTDRMNRYAAENFANAGSVHRGGQRARVALEDAHDRLAQALGCEPKHIVLTSGGTESNNFALKGYAFACRKKHGLWPAILTARTEHHAVLQPVEFLAWQGAQVVYLDVDGHGRVSPDVLEAALQTIGDCAVRPVVSLMHANNETGVLNPIADLAAVARAHNGVFHTDAVQTFGKIPFTAPGLGVDMISMSAHKIHGPKGIGALYIGSGVELEPLIHGGAQQRNRRGGTEPVELAVGFDEAVRLALEHAGQSRAHIQQLDAMLRAGLSAIQGAEIVTPAQGALPGIVNVTFSDAAQLDGEGLIVGMDLQGVAVSNGAACTSGSQQPSHVLAAMGLSAERARAAVRFSLSRYSVPEDVQAGIEALQTVLKQVRGD